MAIPTELRELIDVLEKKSSRQELPWAETPEPGRFYLAYEGLSIQLSRWTREYGDEHGDSHEVRVIGFQLLDAAGEDIIRVDVEEGEPGYAPLANIYQAALIKARNVSGLVKGLVERIRQTTATS